AQIAGRHVHWLPTSRDNRWLLTPGELDKLCRKDPSKPRIVILNYPNNPTGCSYTDAELAALAEVVRKYHVIMLSDEIYGELHFEGEHTSIARHYPEGTIISSGLSKWCGAGGWRLGTFAFPAELDWLVNAMAVVASETFTATSAPIQYAAVRAFRGGPRIEAYLSQSRRILKTLNDHCLARFTAADVFVAPPQGAFYMLPDFSAHRDTLLSRGITTGTELCQRVLEETGVAFLPGSAFGRPEEELTARIALVDFDGAKTLAAAERTPLHEPLPADFLTTNCFKMIEAIDLVCDWIK
ncbi:MAG: pyridoxal phosphate-dependent aminotransferase, partial [Desulfuromonadales bacterium]|nr:pyridoxal phosphate-dependent aminotransferase [Desulfuromonadales bacterium]